MAKPKQRKCARCGAIVPQEIDFSSTDPDLRPWDMMKLGRRQGNGVYFGASSDFCQECIKDYQDNWLKNK